MATVLTFRDTLEYLVHATGRAEGEIVAQAVEHGLTALYRSHVTEAYLAGEVDREQAIIAVGEATVAELDEARRAVEHDVRWGLAGA